MFTPTWVFGKCEKKFYFLYLILAIKRNKANSTVIADVQNDILLDGQSLES